MKSKKVLLVGGDHDFEQGDAYVLVDDSDCSE
jgi:hypothetical protein